MTETQLLLEEAEYKLDQIIKHLQDLSNKLWIRRMRAHGCHIGQGTERLD